MPSLYIGPMKELLSSTVAPKEEKKIMKKHVKMAEDEMKAKIVKRTYKKNKKDC